ncbi:hypothetical protein ACWDZ8_43135 [Streptomyces sp. NPDC003233]
MKPTERAAEQLPDGLGVLVLLPDARACGTVPALAQRLAFVAPRVVAALPVALTPALVARLYWHNAAAGVPDRVDGTWLGRRVFDHGSCVLLLLGAAPGVGGLSELLARWKGPSSAGTRTRGALREVAAFSHKGMSLLHTPDDAVQAWQDLRLLMAPELVDALLEDVAEPRVAWDDVALLHAPLAPAIDLSPTLFLQRVVAKSLALLGTDARLAPWWDGGETAREAARALWDGELAVAGASLPDPAELTARCKPADPLAAALQERTVRQRRELAEVLAMLRAGGRDGPFAEFACTVLKENGVVEGPWEEHMVLVSLVNPVPEADPGSGSRAERSTACAMRSH